MVRILFFYASYTVSLCDFVHRAPNAVVANPTCCSSKSLQPFSAQHDWSSQVARSNLLRAVSQLVEPSNSCCTSKHSANDQLWMGCLTLGLLNAAVFVRPFQICQICNAVANAYGGLGQKISFFFPETFHWRDMDWGHTQCTTSTTTGDVHRLSAKRVILISCHV